MIAAINSLVPLVGLELSSTPSRNDCGSGTSEGCRSAYLRGLAGAFQPEFVHDPPGLDAVGSPPAVEHQRLPHAGESPCRGLVDGSVLSRRLPVTRLRCPVRAEARRVLSVPEAEEVPLVRAQSRRVCNISDSDFDTTMNLYIGF